MGVKPNHWHLPQARGLKMVGMGALAIESNGPQRGASGAHLEAQVQAAVQPDCPAHAAPPPPHSQPRPDPMTMPM